MSQVVEQVAPVTAPRERVRVGKAVRGQLWRIARPVLWLAAVIALWQVAAVLYRHHSPATAATKLPEPSKIASTVWNTPSLFFDALGTTLKGALLGLALGIAIGVFLGVISAGSLVVESAVYPYLVISQMVPTIVLAPIILAVVQDGQLARVLTAAFISFFVIAINVTRGLKNVDPEELMLLRSVNARWYHYFVKLRLPASLPYLFTALKVAAPLSIVGEIVVELTGNQNGLGLLMLTSLKYGGAQIYNFWSAAVFNALLGYAMYLSVALLERWLTPWQPEFRGAR